MCDRMRSLSIRHWMRPRLGGAESSTAARRDWSAMCCGNEAGTRSAVQEQIALLCARWEGIDLEMVVRSNGEVKLDCYAATGGWESSRLWRRPFPIGVPQPCTAMHLTLRISSNLLRVASRIACHVPKFIAACRVTHDVRSLLARSGALGRSTGN